MRMQTPKHRNDFYRALPKVDLHRHLEGSLRLDTMLEIARAHDLDVPRQDPVALKRLVQVSSQDPYTYQNFLSKFTTLRKFFRSPEIIRRVTREAIFDAAEDNLRYLELRFTPVALSKLAGFPMREVMEWVIQAAREAELRSGLKTRLIASFNRHESFELAKKVVALAADCLVDGVVGLDVAGDEANYPVTPFGPLMKDARQAGLRLTVHAGEWGGASNVRQAILDFECERIGHGVRVMEDPETVALAGERGTVFEVCPTSNYQSGVFDSLQSHPLKRMLEAGLAVTLNTDDPGVSDIRLSNELMISGEQLSISPAELHGMTINAIQASFLDPEESAALAQSIGADFDRVLEQYIDHQ